MPVVVGHSVEISEARLEQAAGVERVGQGGGGGLDGDAVIGRVAGAHREHPDACVLFEEDGGGEDLPELGLAHAHAIAGEVVLLEHGGGRREGGERVRREVGHRGAGRGAAGGEDEGDEGEAHGVPP